MGYSFPFLLFLEASAFGGARARHSFCSAKRMYRRLRRLLPEFGSAELGRAPARRFALSPPLQPKPNLLFLHRKCADRGGKRGVAALLNERNCEAIPLRRERRPLV